MNDDGLMAPDDKDRVRVSLRWPLAGLRIHNARTG